ncbi:GntR family transcriptional regulator [Vagococcus salmoninarum]|uniref:GntR family transcriptional regulator n=1 Tax=Vagococcus salmoninarum TaxID=2739 RepID=A0A429ZDF6_9ENTE|nr:GntR family transcriptional regulator [Vagococcus salmoninarum]MBE9390263.1 GntR family transcriptional regulator [Vagococcus salmoninarum]RST91722.1 GntR family transcriptional regulator [Vagococcus salmoninarum]
MPKKNLPVYIQIHDKIREEIESGKWKVGERLPSERELSITFGVSRMTLRQAVQTLADEGILERKIGSGTYVASKKVQETMSGTTSFSEIIIAQGKQPSSKTTSYFVTKPSSSEMETLQLKDEELLLRMERVRYADDVPICFEVTSIPYHLIKNYNKKEVTHSLYQTIIEHGEYKIGKALQGVSAMVASEQIAEHLDIKKGDAILRLRQTTYFDDGTPFEYVRSQYVGNRFEFLLEK